MARAIVRDPKLFLMDEPLSNLDARLRTEVRDGIMTLHQQLKTSTVYVTHDQMEAMTMADRIAVLKGGHLQQIGAPETLYAQSSQSVCCRIYRHTGDEHFQLPCRRWRADSRKPGRFACPHTEHAGA